MVAQHSWTTHPSVNYRQQGADKRAVRDRIYLYFCGAGRGTELKYREASTRWRKRVFRHPTLILGVLGASAGLAAVLDVHSLGPLALGFMIGTLLTGYIALRESPPAYIENWKTGSEGERRTALELAPLRRRGYVLLHDLPDRRGEEQVRRGNIDHVVIGPGGVFLVDSKYLGGEVSIDGDSVLVQRRDDDDASYRLPRLAGAMRGLAMRLQQDIAQQTGIAFVQPVVVFWGPFEAGIVLGDRVVFVHGERLATWLEEQPVKMAPELVVRVADAVAAARPAVHPGWRGMVLRIATSAGGQPLTSRVSPSAPRRG